MVLLDINMPRMNGVEALKEIMKIDQSIAVLMVTGNGELPVTVDAIRNGAFGYVPKPFDLRYLDHLIAASLGPGPATAPKRIARSAASYSRNDNSERCFDDGGATLCPVRLATGG